jgi:hypothetical protein
MKSLTWRSIFGFSGAMVVAAILATNVFAASSTNYAIPGDNASSVGGSSSSPDYVIEKSSGDTVASGSGMIEPCEKINDGGRTSTRKLIRSVLESLYIAAIDIG